MEAVLDDSVRAAVATQHEDVVLEASEGEETETSAEAAETTKKRKRPSKKAARLAEEAAAQAKAEARAHEINLARAKRQDAEILVKDCTINLICRDAECGYFKSAIVKAAGQCNI